MTVHDVHHPDWERWLDEHDRVWVTTLALATLVGCGLALYSITHGDATVLSGIPLSPSEWL